MDLDVNLFSCCFHWHSSRFRFIQMAPQYFFYNLPASESKDVLQRILSQEAPSCHEEEPPLEDQTHDRCVIQWPSDPRWSPEWWGNYKLGPSLATTLHTGAGCLLKNFFLRSSPSAILSMRFICILFSSDQSSKWFLLSFYFKIILSSINVLQSASSSAWLCEGAAWLLKRRRILFFFAPPGLNERGLGQQQEKKILQKGEEVFILSSK